MLKREDYQQHISATFNTELESLRNQMLAMGGAVEQQLASALDALLNMDTGEAQTIIDRDAEVNNMEMAIDDECATIIARRQPAASDLRLVVAIIKVCSKHPFDIGNIGIDLFAGQIFAGHIARVDMANGANP